MRAVLQRVRRASVAVDGAEIAAIGPGLVVLVGVGRDDTDEEALALADKVAVLRIFPDQHAKMNRSVQDVDGAVLVVSQFTLVGDVRKGRRPSFTEAADPAVAVPLLDLVVSHLRAKGITVATGSFGARMEVDLVNDGPVTFVVDVAGGTVV